MRRANNLNNLSRVAKKRGKRKKVFRVITFSLVIILLSVAAITGYASWKVNNFINNTTEPTIVTPIPDQPDSKPEEPKKKSIVDEPYAMLMFGVDYRPETNSLNTDAIIVSIWNPTTKEVSLLSIPRDTKVNIPNYGVGKINAAYAWGERLKHTQQKKGEQPTIDGAHMLLKVLSDYLDIPILYYSKVDFKGFELIIDELGGIEIDVERNMRYHSESDGTNINLKKGLQILDGKQALDYARFRKSSDGNDSSDFERNIRHQKIIKSFVDKVSSFKGLSNIFDILDIAGNHLKTNLTPKEITSIFWKFKDVNKGNIRSIHMESYWENPYVMVDKEEIEKVKASLKAALSGEKVKTQDSLKQ